MLYGTVPVADRHTGVPGGCARIPALPRRSGSCHVRVRAVIGSGLSGLGISNLIFTSRAPTNKRVLGDDMDKRLRGGSATRKCTVLEVVKSLEA